MCHGTDLPGLYQVKRSEQPQKVFPIILNKPDILFERPWYHLFATSVLFPSFTEGQALVKVTFDSYVSWHRSTRTSSSESIWTAREILSDHFNQPVQPLRWPWYHDSANGVSFPSFTERQVLEKVTIDSYVSWYRSTRTSSSEPTYLSQERLSDHFNQV